MIPPRNIRHRSPRSSRSSRSSRSRSPVCYRLHGLEEWTEVHLRKQSFWRLYSQMNEDDFIPVPSKDGFIIAPEQAREYIDLYYDVYEQTNNVSDHAEF